MRYAHLGAVAALARSAQGFLIPPEVSSTETDIVNALPFEDAVGIDGRVLEINCPGCPVMTDAGSYLQAMQTESVLQLNFSTSHKNGADQLLLNGLQIYPIDPTSDSFMEPLTAPQMIKSFDNTWRPVATPPKLGYSLSVKHPTPTGQDQLRLAIIHLEIIEVADKFIKGLPTVDLQLLETPSGKLMIGNAGSNAPTTVSSPNENDKECTTLLCKWRAIVADRLSALRKGCGSKRPRPEVRPVFEPKPHHDNHHPGHRRPPGSVRPHHRPHRPFRHHHRHGSLARFVRGFVLHVLVPILIGIMVGVTASLVGMVVGHIAIFTWRLLFRRGQAQYVQVKQDEASEDVEDESKGLMDHQGPPPQYEDAVPEKREDA